MGLDQYAAIKLETKDEKGNYESEELACWRKHPHLQGFMEELWNGQGCPNDKGDGFNCINLELTIEDIDTLEADIKGDLLPVTGGFFFGNDSSEYYKEQDLEFCTDARKALEDGQTVFYSSWW